MDAATGVVFTTGAAPQRVAPHGAVQVSVPGASTSVSWLYSLRNSGTELHRMLLI